MIDFIKKLLFVRKCICCGEVLENDTQAFCPKCQLEVEKLCRIPCRVCGKSERDCRCLTKNLHGLAFVGVHLFAFDDKRSRRLIYTLKRQNLKALHQTLAKMLADAISDAPLVLSDYVITYAPRKPKSIREYGFDQAALLADALAKALHLPMVDLFCHARFSQLQKNLGAKERAENAEKSYSLRKDASAMTKKLIMPRF